MANRADGVDNPGESLEGDQNSVELASLKADVGSMSDQINKLTMMMAELVSKKEESSGTEESAADRGDAKESAAAGSAGAQGGAPQQIGSARDETYLRIFSRVWSGRTTQRRSRGLCPPRGERSRCSQPRWFW